MAADAPQTTDRFPSRGWRRFRVVLVITLVLATIQAALGGPLAGGAAGGFQIASNASLGAVVSAIMGSGGLLIFHAFEGVLILLLALATSALSFRYGKTRGVRLFATLSLLASLIALLGGYLHMGGSPAGIPMMSEGFIATYAFLFMTLYYTK